jgi:hypothetical protein
VSRRDSGSPVGKGVSVVGRRIESSFEFAPPLFEYLRVRISRNADRISDHNCDATKRQIDFGAIPIIQNDPAAGRERYRKNRPA